MSGEERLGADGVGEAMALVPDTQQIENDDKYRCQHYKRKCRFVVSLVIHLFASLFIKMIKSNKIMEII